MSWQHMVGSADPLHAVAVVHELACWRFNEDIALQYAKRISTNNRGDAMGRTSHQ